MARWRPAVPAGCSSILLCAAGLVYLGVFTLYAIAFATLRLYKIGNETSAFLECALITAGAIVVALRASSVAVVLLGALGGYLTPLLISTGGGRHVELFVYLAFLNVALIACSVLRPWNFLKPLTWAAIAWGVAGPR